MIKIVSFPGATSWKFTEKPFPKYTWGGDTFLAVARGYKQKPDGDGNTDLARSKIILTSKGRHLLVPGGNEKIILFSKETRRGHVNSFGADIISSTDERYGGRRYLYIVARLRHDKGFLFVRENGQVKIISWNKVIDIPEDDFSSWAEAQDITNGAKKIFAPELKKLEKKSLLTDREIKIIYGVESFYAIDTTYSTKDDYRAKRNNDSRWYCKTKNMSYSASSLSLVKARIEEYSKLAATYKVAVKNINSFLKGEESSLIEGVTICSVGTEDGKAKAWFSIPGSKTMWESFEIPAEKIVLQKELILEEKKLLFWETIGGYLLWSTNQLPVEEVDFKKIAKIFEEAGYKVAYTGNDGGGIARSSGCEDLPNGFKVKYGLLSCDIVTGIKPDFTIFSGNCHTCSGDWIEIWTKEKLIELHVEMFD